VFLKCENFQKVGAFKARGAINAVLRLDQNQARRGVATHSSGNHGAALAYAAQCRGLKAHVVMPENAAAVKRAAVAAYGAEIVFCEPTLGARETTLLQVVEQTGASFVHPFNDYDVICGQGTAALEFCEQVSELDTIIAPVGGGGLLSGTALAAHAIRPGMHVLGVEPEAADDAFRSLEAGRIIPVDTPQTIADGLRTSLGTLTFPIIREYVDAIVTVDEAAIVEAMRYVWERAKLIIEPSAAVPLAALFTKRVDIPGDRIGVILSGGNVDLECLPWTKKQDRTS
jgi:threonine dehydratase